MALEPLFPRSASVLVCASAFLWLNAAALIWLHRYFDPAYRRPRTGDDEESIARIVSPHGITKRESEIIDLILLGRSNKEIAGALFISLNTVKNHIYSIYQKIGVKSRGQLVGMFLADRGE